MDNRFTNLPSNIINLIWTFDGTYREKYNSVVEEINELNMMRYCLDCDMNYFYDDYFYDDSGIDEYLEEMEDMEEPEYEPDEPPIITKDDFLGDFVFEEETEELTDIEKLFLFIDDDEIDFSGDFVCPKPICYYYFDKILIFGYC